MTLDYKKMFLIVTEEAVVKGHFTILNAVVSRPMRGRFFIARIRIRVIKKQAAERPPNMNIIAHSTIRVKRFCFSLAQICMLHKDLLCILDIINS